MNKNILNFSPAAAKLPLGILVAAPQGSGRLQVLDRAGERVWNTSGELAWACYMLFSKLAVCAERVFSTPVTSRYTLDRGPWHERDIFLIFYWPLAHPDFKFQKDSPTLHMSTNCSNSIRVSDGRTDGRDSPENPSTIAPSVEKAPEGAKKCSSWFKIYAFLYPEQSIYRPRTVIMGYTRTLKFWITPSCTWEKT